MVPAELDDYIAPENKARARIDEMLQRAGWVVQDYKSVNLYAGVGVAAVSYTHLTLPTSDLV